MQRIVTSSKAKKVLGKPRKGTDSDSVQAKAKVEKLPVCVWWWWWGLLRPSPEIYR